jgi:hypothetical protein
MIQWGESLQVRSAIDVRMKEKLIVEMEEFELICQLVGRQC